MFCRNCAELLADTDITCPRCGFAVGSGIKYCGTCGSVVEPGAVVCELCGNPLNTAFNGQAQVQFGQQYAQQPQPFAQQAQPYAQPYAQQGTSYAQQTPPYSQQASPYGQQASPYGQQAPRYAQPYGQQQAFVPTTQKSKAVAGVLGILFGALGVHNFYLGYTSKAMVQLLMTIFSCGALSFISAVWGLVEGIMILTGSINTDGKGIPLKE